MKKVIVDSWSWLYLHFALDWKIQKIVDSTLSLPNKINDWFEAGPYGANEQFPSDVQEAQGLKFGSDNVPQPTSMKFIAPCYSIENNQSFTSYNNPKGNSDIEGVVRTIKKDFIWTRDWFSFEQLNLRFQSWFKDFLYSAKGDKNPVKFEQQFST